LGVALPVNPGEHVVVTQVPGGLPHEQRVVLEKGDSKAVVVELDTTPANATAAPSVTASAAPSVTASASAPFPMRTVGLVAGGVGVVGLGVGLGVGALLFDKKAAISSHCKELVCDHEGKQAADSARTIGLASEITFGVGAAALVGGAVLFLLAPSR